MGTAGESGNGRVSSIDVMRGLVMVLMTLDNVRGNLTVEAAKILGAAISSLPMKAEDLDLTTPLIFCMRWITHLCAPAFLFLAGTGVYLWVRRHGAERSAARYLLVRGSLIILLNMVVRPFSLFSFDGHIGLFVLWAIGMSMILLVPAMKLSRAALWLLALGIVFGHNLLDGVTIPVFFWDALLKIGLTAGSVPLSAGPNAIKIIAPYPILPWFAVMLLGYLSGGLFTMKGSRGRQRIHIAAGIFCLVFFAVLRLSGGYGDPLSWQHFDAVWKTMASFVKVTKYPPSLQFLLVTLGLMLVVLAWIERLNLRPRLLLVLGSVPLLFYVAHIALIRAVIWVLKAAGESPVAFIGEWICSPGGVLVLTIPVTAALYPLCLWRMRARQRRRKRANSIN